MGNNGIERITGDSKGCMGIRERTSGVLPGTAGRRGQEVHLMTTQIRHIDRGEIRRQLWVRDDAVVEVVHDRSNANFGSERFVQCLGCFNHAVVALPGVNRHSFAMTIDGSPVEHQRSR